MSLTRKLMVSRNARLLLALISLTLLLSPVALAGTKITQSTCPVVINQPGVYSLATDVGPCAAGVDGIDIRSSNVTLQLAGHTVSGSVGGTGTCNSSTGIRVGFLVPAVTGVSVQGDGTIRDFFIGLYALNSSDSSVKKVTVTAACPFFSYGIVLAPPGGDWQLEGNVVREPGLTSAGIYVFGVNDNDFVRNDVNDTMVIYGSSNNTIVNNTANDNHAGIFLGAGSNNNEIHANTTNNNITNNGLWISAGSTGNNITGNKSTGNLPLDMEDDNPNCGTNKWEGNRFNTANQPCIQ